MEFKQFVVVQQKVIRNLMADEWFMRADHRIKNHPAYKRYKICESIISNPKPIDIRWPEDKALLAELCEVSLDCIDIVRASGSAVHKTDFTSWVLGDFSGYGNADSSKRVKSVVFNPTTFSSLLVEMSLCAWCISREYEVTPIESHGHPDLLVSDGRTNSPTIIECKKILEGTSIKRISKIINHANTQIKNLGLAGYGVAVIDVSVFFKQMFYDTDEIPLQIEAVIEVVRNIISKNNTSVSGVLLVWHDYRVIFKPIVSNMLSAAFRRRTYLVRHACPKVALPSEHFLEAYGATVLSMFNMTPSIEENIQPSRNKPCDCGSGLRFKHCCGYTG